MKNTLPDNHGLPSSLLSQPEIMFLDGGEPSLTDVQWEALDAGVGRGMSLLVLAPTSTGKTQIAVWALATWIMANPTRRRAVYLVTHRSLANQKFEELQRLFVDPVFSGAPEAVVLATGDRQENATGAPVSEPLQASLLIATYEKYLGLLCSGGIPSNLGDCAIVADEVQILGDKTRGVNIEILLTVIRGAEPGQFVGLSAVLNKKDAEELANWLAVPLVRVPLREKHLFYECRTPKKRLTFHTERSEEGILEEDNPNTSSKLQAVIRERMALNSGKPIVVFCMRKKDIYSFAKAYCRSNGISVVGAPLLEGLSSDTPEAELLSNLLPNRIAIHCTDLVEGDRLRVEAALKNREVDLVFATSTLAAGVNFPIGTVIFGSWVRWNPDRRRYETILASEFHNMSGRCGRMGSEHESGHIIFLADDSYQDASVVRDFLNPDHLDSLESQIVPEYFTSLILQLTASNVVETEEATLKFLKSSFGASRELEINKSGLAHWSEPFTESVGELRGWAFLR